jgi:uncharacterized repeat protein (TIGR01451 family)
MNTDGSGQTRLTADAGFDGYPAWSPDGTKLAFSSNRSGQAYIYVMNANGTGVTQLSNQMYSYNPVWSPDGSKIAYDADQENDGWQELWVMDANGANQQMKYDPYGQIDAWAHSWSPDGRYIAYTLISFTYYQGAWYWVDAYLDAFSVQQNSTVRLSSSGLDWNPDWQTIDVIKPTAAAVPLPGTSPAPIVVRWSGSDTGGAGMQGYDVQVKTGVNGGWADWLTNTTLTSSAYTAVGGQTYAFRVRARDNAHNVSNWSPVDQAVTTVEALPPQTAVSPLPPFSRADEDLPVAWGGTDPGNSGIASFDLQYRLNGTWWVNWLTETSLSAALLPTNAQPGDVLDLRSRGRDLAQNLESWSANADATTTFYRWGIGGQVHDNVGAPIGGAAIQTTPLALNNALSSSEGAFGSYIASVSDVYSVTVSKTGYGPLPVTGYPFGPDASVQVALPPINDVIRNGHFEAGSLKDNWTTDSDAIVLTDSLRHTGNQSVQFGTIQLYGEPDLLAIGPNYTNFHTAVGADNWIHVIMFYNNNWLYFQADPDGSWSPVQELPHSTDCQLRYNDQQDMKVQADGTVQLVWVAENRLSSPYDEWLCYYEQTAAGIWRPLETYHFNEFPGQGTDFRHVNFKIAPDGVIHVTWMHRTANYKWRLFYAWRDTNGVWSNKETIAESLGDDWFKTWLYVPDLAIEPNGTVHFVWMQYETSTSSLKSKNLFYRFRAPGGQWSPTEQITPYGQQSNPPSLMTKLNIDGNGVLHLVYISNTSSSNDGIYYMRRTAGSWSPITFLGISNSFVDVLLDPEDYLHVIWAQDFIPHYARTSGLLSGFTQFTLPEAPNRKPILRPDALGRLHFLWMDQVLTDDVYIVLDAQGNQLDRQEVPNLYYAGFELDQKAWPHFFGQDIEGTSGMVHIGPARIQQDRDLTLSQTVSVPVGMEAPVLSYFYLYNGLIADEHNSFDVLLDDGQMSVIAQQSQVNRLWQHQWVDLSPWAGETITLTFRLHQEQYAPNTWLFVDDVSLGSAHPDLWLAVEGGSGLPGEQIEQTLTYGNRGGAVAAETRLTYTLPAELAFVSASVPPVSTSPLVWELGDLPAKSQPLTLSVVVQISPTAVPFTTLTSTAVIQPADSELETLNNSTQGRTFIVRLLYLPMLQR